MPAASGEATDIRSFHRLLLFLSLAIAAIFFLRYFQFMQQGSAIFAEDFQVFWRALASFADWPPASPYLADTHQPYITMNGATSYHPFLNPPFFLFLLWPLRALSYGWALGVCYALQMLLWLWILHWPSVKAWWPTLAARGRLHYAATCLLLSLPFWLITLLSGQMGILFACALLASMSLRRDKPGLAGLWLALLWCKPTLLPLPVLWLLVEKNTRALAALFLAGLALAAAATACWGGAIWPEWFSVLHLQASILAQPVMPPRFAQQLASAYNAALLLDAPRPVALIVQVIATLASLFAVLRTAQQKTDTCPIILYLGLFLFSAYIYQYDMPILTAVLLAMLDAGYRNPLSVWSRIAFICLLACPLLSAMLQAHNIPFALGVILLLWDVAFRQRNKTI